MNTVIIVVQRPKQDFKICPSVQLSPNKFCLLSSQRYLDNRYNIDFDEQCFLYTTKDKLIIWYCSPLCELTNSSETIQKLISIHSSFVYAWMGLLHAGNWWSHNVPLANVFLLHNFKIEWKNWITIWARWKFLMRHHISSLLDGLFFYCGLSDLTWVLSSLMAKYQPSKSTRYGVCLCNMSWIFGLKENITNIFCQQQTNHHCL